MMIRPNDSYEEDEDEFMPPAFSNLADSNSARLTSNNVVQDEEEEDVGTTTISIMTNQTMTTHMHQDPYECWVVVYGFQREDTQLVLYQFASYGSIVRQTSGIRTGNFMCLKYSTRMQAVKALCQNGTFVSGSQDLIGVRKVDSRFASEVGLNIHDDANSDLALPLIPFDATVKEMNETKVKSPSKATTTDGDLTADDIMIERKIEPTFTYRVLAWLFNW